MQQQSACSCHQQWTGDFGRHPLSSGGGSCQSCLPPLLPIAATSYPAHQGQRGTLGSFFWDGAVRCVFRVRNLQHAVLIFTVVLTLELGKGLIELVIFLWVALKNVCKNFFREAFCMENSHDLFHVHPSINHPQDQVFNAGRSSIHCRNAHVGGGWERLFQRRHTAKLAASHYTHRTQGEEGQDCTGELHCFDLVSILDWYCCCYCC
mmetsp:Transcript_6148/g.12638  ORF Transcript_6148/g.12638 Transcript_6148/m.12638 type:complete len:207 (+) Transcript_6148:960-1580(+)